MLTSRESLRRLYEGECGFAVVPQLQLRIGYEVCPGVRLTAGYDCLWWTDVVRPADKIDRVTNLTQRFGGALSGAARPAHGLRRRKQKYGMVSMCVGVGQGVSTLFERVA